MSSVVLDASSVLAVLHRELGAESVEVAIGAGASISAVNLSEVVARLADGGVSEEAIREAIVNIKMTVVPFDGDLAFRTGLLRPRTRKLGLSFGDRACLALAQQLGLPVVTADRAWAELDIGVVVHLVR